MFVLDELRFWAQVLQDAQRTIVCPPKYEHQLRNLIEARGLGGQLTVVASAVCPPDRLVVVDEHAMEAAMRQWLGP